MESSEQNNNEKVQRLISKESARFTDYDSSDFSDFDGYYDNDDEVEAEVVSDTHALLEEDIERLRAIYGQEALSYRLFSLVDSIDIELQAQTKFLERDMAVAWKIKPEEPLVIRLHLSASHYLDAEVPKVEVFQPSQKENFGVGSQMKKILENYLFEEWKNLSNDLVRRELKPKLNLNPLKSEKKDSATGPSPMSMYVQPPALAKIIEMGFSPEVGKNALIISRGNLDEAVTLLLNNPECCEESTEAQTLTGPRVPNRPPKTGLQRMRSRDGKACGTRLSVASTDPGGTGSGSTSAYSLLSDLWSKLLGPKPKTGRDAKDRPSLDQGFLVMIMRYVYQRLPTLNEFCVVCDELHVFQNGGMLKPAVCSRELCVFAFSSLGVMSDAADDIATGAEVVDLLIAMANAACRSTRREDVFEPFPSVVNPTKPKEFALSPKKKDFNRVKGAIDGFMRMSDMVTLRGVEIKRELDKRDVLAYPLLQWIVSSNRSHIVKLPTERQMACVGTPHQFLLMSSPPAKEAIFREAKGKYGSVYAFHGSPLENWHSIMRQGLMNASGTRYQRNGAAYGKGIYLSPKASVSQNYSGMTQYGSPRSFNARQQQLKAASRPGPPLPQTSRPGGPSPPRPGPPGLGGKAGTHGGQPSFNRQPGRFLQSTNLTCIALCEVVTSSSLKKHGNIWVMPEADHVCTRFFFVYEDGQVGDGNLDTSSPEFQRQIMRVVH